MSAPSAAQPGPTRIRLLANLKARSVDTAADALAAITARPGVELVATESREHTVEIARETARAGDPLIASAGGDGTANAVAQGLLEAGTGATALAIVPLGTGNDLARSLAIPLDPLEAAALWDEPRVRTIDAVAIERPGGATTTFINVTTAGDGARVAGRLTDEMKKKWGALCFVRGAIPDLLDPTVYDVALELDGTYALREHILGAAFANARTAAGGIELAPRASCEDGWLDVVVVREGGAVDLAALAARYVVQGLLASDQVTFRRARTLRVRSDPALPLSVDGEELQACTDVTFRVLPHALPVVVGPTYAAS